jgi:putative ABC transport system permease protein
VLRWGGAFGLFLAVVGNYGIVSFAVTQRTREMAIRMAIGAELRQVLRSVVKDGTRPALIGMGLGLVFAFLMARLMSKILVGVSPMDPRAFVGGTLVLAPRWGRASSPPVGRWASTPCRRSERSEGGARCKC